MMVHTQYLFMVFVLPKAKHRFAICMIVLELYLAIQRMGCYDGWHTTIYGILFRPFKLKHQLLSKAYILQF